MSTSQPTLSLRPNTDSFIATDTVSIASSHANRRSTASAATLLREARDARVRLLAELVVSTHAAQAAAVADYNQGCILLEEARILETAALRDCLDSPRSSSSGEEVYRERSPSRHRLDSADSEEDDSQVLARHLAELDHVDYFDFSMQEPCRMVDDQSVIGLAPTSSSRSSSRQLAASIGRASDPHTPTFGPQADIKGATSVGYPPGLIDESGKRRHRDGYKGEAGDVNDDGVPPEERRPLLPGMLITNPFLMRTEFAARPAAFMGPASFWPQLVSTTVPTRCSGDVGELLSSSDLVLIAGARSSQGDIDGQRREESSLGWAYDAKDPVHLDGRPQPADRRHTSGPLAPETRPQSLQATGRRPQSHIAVDSGFRPTPWDVQPVDYGTASASRSVFVPKRQRDEADPRTLTGSTNWPPHPASSRWGAKRGAHHERKTDSGTSARAPTGGIPIGRAIVPGTSVREPNGNGGGSSPPRSSTASDRDDEDDDSSPRRRPSPRAGHLPQGGPPSSVGSDYCPFRRSSRWSRNDGHYASLPRTVETDIKGLRAMPDAGSFAAWRRHFYMVAVAASARGALTSAWLHWTDVRHAEPDDFLIVDPRWASLTPASLSPSVA